MLIIYTVQEKERNMERGTRCVERGLPAQDTSEPGHPLVQEKNCQQ
jgi:hypothetical protein